MPYNQHCYSWFLYCLGCGTTQTVHKSNCQQDKLRKKYYFIQTTNMEQK